MYCFWSYRQLKCRVRISVSATTKYKTVRIHIFINAYATAGAVITEKRHCSTGSISCLNENLRARIFYSYKPVLYRRPNIVRFQTVFPGKRGLRRSCSCSYFNLSAVIRYLFTCVREEIRRNISTAVSA